ncbi:MAG: DUF2764 family protein [Chlamydiia bacterium]|nr:DUF2764 family protein [Chlamydiia bacterium]
MDYYLPVALPDLHLFEKPEMRFQEVIELFEEHLGKTADVAQVRLLEDLENIRKLWRGEPLSPYGNLDHNQLEEALSLRINLPQYVFDFLDHYDQEQERLGNFPELIATYFQETSAEGFLNDYLNFERSIRLVLTGFRAKNMGRDVMHELRFEDPDDAFVQQILAQKDAKVYEPPMGFEALKDIFERSLEEPLKLHQDLIKFRFYRLEEMYGLQFFSRGRLLCYLIQLMLVEKWMALDKREGINQIHQILEVAS